VPPKAKKEPPKGLLIALLILLNVGGLSNVEFNIPLGCFVIDPNRALGVGGHFKDLFIQELFQGDLIRRSSNGYRLLGLRLTELVGRQHYADEFFNQRRTPASTKKNPMDQATANPNMTIVVVDKVTGNSAAYILCTVMLIPMSFRLW